MNDMIYTELINGMTWSYSRIKCFDDCRYRFFLKYIKHEEEIPQFYSSYGSFMHKLIELYYKGQLNKEQMKIRFLTDFQKEVQGERPQAGIVKKYIESGINYLESFKEFPFNMVSVEEKVEFDIDGIPFVGFIDYIGEKDGEYHIVDNKSRDLKPRSNRQKPTKKDEELDKMLVQLYLYAAAVKQKYGKFPKTLRFNCFRTGVFIQEPFDEEKYEEAIEWAKQSIEDIKSDSDFYPWIEYFGCRYICDVRDECIYWQEGAGR